MNATHSHLLLNHVGLLGIFLGFILMVLGCWRKSDARKRDSLYLFLVTALATIPVFLSGKPATHVVQYLPDVSRPLMARHEEVAQFALALVVLLGVISLGGLILFRRQKPFPAWFAVVILVLALAAGGVMAWTANLGGQIRHSEIRPQG